MKLDVFLIGFEMKYFFGKFAVLSTSLVLLAACSADPSSYLAQSCRAEIKRSGQAIDRAASGDTSVVAITKARSFLAAAEAQNLIERYQSCIDKARRARSYLVSSS